MLGVTEGQTAKTRAGRLGRRTDVDAKARCIGREGGVLVAFVGGIGGGAPGDEAGSVAACAACDAAKVASGGAGAGAAVDRRAVGVVFVIGIGVDGVGLWVRGGGGGREVGDDADVRAVGHMVVEGVDGVAGVSGGAFFGDEVFGHVDETVDGGLRDAVATGAFGHVGDDGFVVG